MSPLRANLRGVARPCLSVSRGFVPACNASARLGAQHASAIHRSMHAHHATRAGVRASLQRSNPREKAGKGQRFENRGAAQAVTRSSPVLRSMGHARRTS